MALHSVRTALPPASTRTDKDQEHLLRMEFDGANELSAGVD